MPNIGELLSHHNIKIPSETPGRYYTTCPWCSAQRKPEHRKLKCLGVTIKQDRVFWGCNNCQITGPTADDLPHYNYGENRKSRVNGRFVWEHFTDAGWQRGAAELGRGMLYRGEEALESGQTILVVEGEKDVDTLWKHGFAATCAPHGCNTWTSEHAEQLRGRDLVVLNDNDEAGYKYAAKVVATSIGVALSVRRLDLKDYWPTIEDGDDITDWFDSGGGFAQALGDILAELPELNGHDKRTEPTAKEHVPDRVQIWMPLELDGAPVPDPAYTVQGRIPANQVTLFTGHGGIGKSTIGLQLACGHVLHGGHWLSSVPSPGPAWFIDAEDPKDIIHWRLERILRTYNATFQNLIRGGLKVAALSGLDTVLAHQDRRTGLILPTPLYEHLLEEASDTKPVQIVIASLANVFAGNENDRTQVQQFINLLKRFTLRTSGSLVLIAHPSKSALADGNGFSGSTAWFNATRAQINLEAADETGLRKLSFPKNQYGTETAPLSLRWREGVFVPEGTGEAAYEKAAREEGSNSAFLENLRTLMAQGRNLSHKSSSRSNYAPKVFAAIPGAKYSEKDFAAAMERLFASGKIRVATYGFASRGWERIEPVP